MTRLPIRLRLTLAFALAMAVVLAVMGAFVYVRLGSALMASVDQTLHSQSDEAIAGARLHRPALTDPDVAGGTTLAQVLGPDGAVLRSSPAGLPPLVHSTPSPGGRLLRSVELRSPGGDWRVLAVRPVGLNATVVVARSLEPREESLHRLSRELAFAIPLALLLTSLGAYLLASAALRPVEAMRRRAAAVSADAPTLLPVPRSRDEVSRLAETLNDMLARLHASLEHERRFVADASHELRTPLALLRTELELALRRPRPRQELEAALRSAAEETERLSRLAEDLLLIARGDRGGLPLRRRELDVEEVLETAASRFARHAESVGASVVVAPTHVRVDADPERIEQALGNLLDNALAHGAREVVVSARRVDGTVELHVLDDGPGFPASFLERAFDRFSRADEARSQGGAGLGLSIVALIAAAHGGAAAVANRREGGADAWITLPTLG
ncbi:MAG TPA: ATP-binding protein [Gaiellaceae bacterium]|nr:ATP-binding protein [Gaiellaceae bacterium]